MEDIFNSATFFIAGELAKLLFYGLIGKLDRPAATAVKKLRRLEMLRIEINSAVEVFDKHTIENASLVQWRDNLKEATARAEVVLGRFRQRAADAVAAAQAQATGGGAHPGQQQQERPSSSNSTDSAVAIASRSAPSGMVQGVHSVARTLFSFSSDEDMERLNNAVEELEELLPEIGNFIKLLKLEILKPEQPSMENTERTAKRMRVRLMLWSRPSSPLQSLSFRDSLNNLDAHEAKIGAPPVPTVNKWGAASRNLLVSETPAPMYQTVPTQEEEERRALVDRLEQAFAAICRAVEVADGRDLGDCEWLGYWASVLRGAKKQGCAVFGGTSQRAVAVVDAGAAEGVVRCDDPEDCDLGGFVCSLESLAGQVDHFSGLACLCPAVSC